LFTRSWVRCLSSAVQTIIIISTAVSATGYLLFPAAHLLEMTPCPAVLLRKITLFFFMASVPNAIPVLAAGANYHSCIRNLSVGRDCKVHVKEGNSGQITLKKDMAL